MAGEPNSAHDGNTPSTMWAFWAVTAAFGTYFCMYGFRKPFTAASFTDAEAWGIDFKTVVVATQVFGYMLSKFVGIKIVSEMQPGRRAAAIITLIAVAELGLIGFGATPRPWNAAWLFVNGFSLGMVFGLVLGFLEGRRQTEALAAGLCTSFILADGVTKSVGTWLLQQGVAEDWMPAVAGAIFVVPLCASVALLSRVPAPNRHDVAARSARPALDRRQRWSLYGRYAGGLSLLVAMYLLITVVRSIRADFAPELWRGLGVATAPGIFTRSEFLVAVGILVANGCAVYVRDNRLAFFVSLATCATGFLVILAALAGQRARIIEPFPFMVLVGLGLYLPYVAMHTTVFERLLAMTRARGNLGFLMYVADAFGYLGYVAVMLARNFWTGSENFLEFFVGLCWLASLLSLTFLLLSWRYFATRSVHEQGVPATEGAA